MATETLSWNAVSGGTPAFVDGETLDTGAVVASISASVDTGQISTQDPNYPDPINTSDFDATSQLNMLDYGAGADTLTVSFTDDSSDGVVSGAYDATFGINDIDGGASSGSHIDEVTISALDVDGNPLTVTATSGGSFTVTNNPDGSVTLVGLNGTNATSDPSAYSLITVQGGPIASISVSLEDIRSDNNNIALTDITYTTNPICFARGTMILTDRGEVAVEELRSGDLVQTKDHGPQEIRWIDSQTLSGATLKAAPHLRPIRISAGALGENIPTRDLVVSPQHRVLVRSRIAQRMFGTDEVLVAAKQLLLIDGIDVADDLDSVDYYHFLFQEHEVVIANGAESESLHTGPQALRTIGKAARAEIFEIFPQLAEIDYEAQSARVLASGRMGRRLAHRHAQNNKMLVS